MHHLVLEQIKRAFYGSPSVKQEMPAIERKVIAGEISPTQAATRLLRLERSGGGMA
jgi:hypothetical protein